MRLIDADMIKQKYRDKFIKSLVDEDRGIDLSEYAEEPSKSFNRFIDEIPTVDAFEQIRAEIEDLYIITNPASDPYDGGYYTALIDVKRIIDKYTKGDTDV